MRPFAKREQRTTDARCCVAAAISVAMRGLIATPRRSSPDG